MAINFKNLPDKELIYGAKGCQGCGAFIASRLALKILGERTILLCPACCYAATTSNFPQNAMFFNNAITAFPGLAATTCGVASGAEMLGLDDVTVLALGGDGGTVDIGLQGLSGACERNDNIIYLCYDNEAYMNTGIQRSGSTPYGGWTTTTPVGKVTKGEQGHFRKNLFDIVTAHRIPYAATASVAYPKDFMEKMAKAKEIKGCRVIHISAPCPTGWGFDPSKTVELAKLAVESGLWQLLEYENDKVKISYQPKEFKDFIPYFKQRRFRHFTDKDFEIVKEVRDTEWDRIKKRVASGQ